MRRLLIATMMVLLACSFVGERSQQVGSRSFLSERTPVEEASGAVYWLPEP